jgi:hypothetical protein
VFPSLITVSATALVEVGVAATVFAVVAIVTAFVATTVLAVAGDALTVMLRPAQKDLPHSRATRCFHVSKAQSVRATERWCGALKDE